MFKHEIPLKSVFHAFETNLAMTAVTANILFPAKVNHYQEYQFSDTCVNLC